MENPSPIEPSKTESVIRHLAGGFIASIKFVGHQLATSDQNPHEGRLRHSVMPVEHMHIPDFPPVSDEIL